MLFAWTDVPPVIEIVAVELSDRSAPEMALIPSPVVEAVSSEWAVKLKAPLTV